MSALQDFIRQAFATNWEWTERYIDGLSQAEIEYRPTDQSHSIGFILWHYGRALDMWVQTRAKRGTQLYEDGWAERLGLPADPADVGFGYGVADLNAWPCPDKDLLVEYATAARNNLLEYLASLDEEALLTTEMTTRTGDIINLARMFSILLWEVNQHGGQASYLRGMQRGLGQ
ncbi:MAG: DinB family protein [Chloroflexota bacterium]|nr:DinB family protein [Chloroflexota bacterium]